MTPTDIETAARQRYNAVGDTFWSQAEILQLLYEACLELATKAYAIERTFTTTSVASQQEYSWPTYAVRVMRVTYSNVKLKPINFREQDTLTLSTDVTAITGTPRYYAYWNNVFYLTPTPDTTGDTIKVFAYVQPQTITASSTLEIPTEYHAATINYIVAHMNLKDKNYAGYERYMGMWQIAVKEAVKGQKESRRGDAFTAVLDEELLQTSWLGGV